MTKREIAVLALKMFGLYALFSALVGIPGLFSLPGLASHSEPPVYRTYMLLSYTLPMVVMLAFFLILWRNANAIASSIFPEQESNEVNHAGCTCDVRVTALWILGLYALIQSLPHLVSLILYAKSSADYHGVTLWQELVTLQKGNFATSVAQVMLGLILIVASQRIAGMMVSGTRPVTESEAE